MKIAIHGVIISSFLVVVWCQQNLVMEKVSAGFVYEQVSQIVVQRGIIEIQLHTEVSSLIEIEDKMIKLINETRKYCNNRCQIYLENMEAIYEEVKFYEAVSKRTKRSVGSWFLGLFGLKSIDPMEEYNVRILKDNQDLLEAKVSEVVSTHEKTHDWVSNLMKKVYGHVNEAITKIQNQFGVSADNTTAIIEVLVAFEHIAKQYERSLRILTKSLDRIYNPMEYEVYDIIKDHPEILSQLKYYKEMSFGLTKIFSFSDNGGYITTVHIPIHDEITYELLSVIPVPSIKDEKIVMPQTQTTFVAVNKNSRKYLTFSRDELESKCTTFSKTVKSCVLHQTINYNEGSDCAVRNMFDQNIKCPSMLIQKSKGYYQKLLNTGGWLVVKPAASTINIICNRQEEQINITGTNVLQINRNCILRDKELTLYPYETNIISMNIMVKNLSSLEISAVHTGTEQLISLAPLQETDFLIGKTDMVSTMNLHLKQLVGRPMVIYGSIGMMHIFVIGLICFYFREHIMKFLRREGKTES